MKHLLLLVGSVALLAVGCQTTDEMMETETLESEMNSESETMSESMETQEYLVTLQVVQGSPTPIAPVAWAVHTGPNPFLQGEMGEKLPGLEALAEDGDPSQINETLGSLMQVKSHGVANTPKGMGSPGPATPGESYTFSLEAAAGDKLSFATMYVQSNDLFFSSTEEGLSLGGDMGVTGNITRRVSLYDAGTEINQEPGRGSSQAPRQPGPDSGMREEKPVMMVDPGMAEFSYPSVDQVLRVTVEHGGM